MPQREIDIVQEMRSRNKIISLYYHSCIFYIFLCEYLHKECQTRRGNSTIGLLIFQRKAYRGKLTEKYRALIYSI